MLYQSQKTNPVYMQLSVNEEKHNNDSKNHIIITHNPYSNHSSCSYAAQSKKDMFLKKNLSVQQIQTIKNRDTSVQELRDLIL